jgi:hypothetical protein
MKNGTVPPTAPDPGVAHYRKPALLTRRVMNPLVALATRHGLSVWGSRILQVRGSTTGIVREVGVNMLAVDGGG